MINRTMTQAEEREARMHERKRMRILRRYIEALTVRPDNPLDVIHAVGFDLTRIHDQYSGSLARACGDPDTAETS